MSDIEQWQPLVDALSNEPRFSENDINSDFLIYLAQELQKTMRALFGPEGPYYHSIPIFPHFLFGPTPAFQVMAETLLDFRNEKEWFLIDLTPSPDMNDQFLELYTRLNTNLESKNLLPKPVLFFSPLLGDLAEEATKAANKLHWPITDIEDKTTHVIFPPPLASSSFLSDTESLSVPGFPSSTVGVTIDWLIESSRLNEWQPEQEFPARPGSITSPPPPTPMSPAPMEAGEKRTVKVEDKDEYVPEVKKSREEKEEEQRKRADAIPLVPEYSMWFDLDSVHDKEKEAFTEFFDEKIATKNPNLYFKWRNFIIKAWRSNPSEYLTFTSIRRCLTGDVCSMQRVFAFLEHWRLINYKVDHPKEKEPQPREALPEKDSSISFTSSPTLSAHPEHYFRPPQGWSNEDISRLLTAINDCGDDWDAIAEKVGRGATECIEVFLTLPIENKAVEREIVLDKGQKGGQNEPDLIALSRKLMENVPSDLATAIANAVSNTITQYNEENNSSVDINDPNVQVTSSLLYNSQLRLNREKDEVRDLLIKACELQSKRLEAKLKHLEHSFVVLDQERAELDRMKKQVIRERVELRKKSLQSQEQVKKE
ncbi:hypothetical protein P9112_007927 [Eukaryota sp. TZLM1-RC]